MLIAFIQILLVISILYVFYGVQALIKIRFSDYRPTVRFLQEFKGVSGTILFILMYPLIKIKMLNK